MALIRPIPAKSIDISPLHFSGTSILIAEKNTDYTLSASDTAAHFITNGISGSVTITHVSGTDAPTVYKNMNDGSSIAVSAGTITVDETVLGFSFVDIAAHVASYTFNFSY